jgi:glycosyltransferase involved in cell wall biosynthesis
MKFAVLSHNLPPSPGQALVLYKLLSGIDPSQYVLISQKDYESGIGNGGAGGGRVAHYDAVSASAKLPVPYYKVSEPPQLRRGSKFGLKYVRKAINHSLACRHYYRLADEIEQILKKEKCEAIVACTAHLWNIPAAYRAAKKLGIAFFPYYFDWYHYQWIGAVERRTAGKFEPVIVKNATRVIVPNETICDELMRRFGVEPVVIHNPVDLSVYGFTDGVGNLPVEDALDPNGTIRIVYTGAIYDAQADAIKTLISAMKRLTHLRLKLEIYTSFSHEHIESLGICASSGDSSGESGSVAVEINEYLPFERIAEIQMQADILFLPLAFETQYPPELIRTSAPGKLGELLAARRPVLVHAPKGSFPAEYFKKYECGFVVDERDESKLADTIELIIADSTARNSAVKNAGMRAVADFDLIKERAKFAGLMK